MAESKDKSREYHTRQRELILGYLRLQEDEPLSIGAIHAGLKETGQQVGKTTVYRALLRLTEQGVVNRYEGADGSALYQYRPASCAMSDHIHLKCLGCGRIIHLSCGLIEQLNAHLNQAHGFSLDQLRTVIYGYCQECRPASKSAEVTADNEERTGKEEGRHLCDCCN